MTEQIAGQSPRMKARIAGIFYLLTIVTGALALVVKGPLRSAMLLGSTGCYVAVTILFYGLFRPVDRNISAIAAVLSLTGCAVSILGLFHPGSAGLNPLVFFGCYCLMIRLPHFPVDIFASNPPCPDGTRRTWLADLCLARTL